MKKVVIYVIGAILLLVVIFFSLPSILSITMGKDDALLNDKHLIPATISVQTSGNAYTLLSKIDTDKTFTDDDYKKLNEWVKFDPKSNFDWGIVQAMYAKNKINIGLYNEAAKQVLYQSPNTASADAAKLGNPMDKLNPTRNTAKLVSINSVYLAEHNRLPEAIQQLTAVLTIGTLIKSSQTSTIAYLVGVSQVEQALSTFEYLDSHYKISNKDKSTFLKNVGRAKNNSGLRSSLQFEYLLIKNGVADIQSGKFAEEIKDKNDDNLDTGWVEYKKKGSNKYYFKPNQTVNDANKYYSSLISIVDKPCAYNAYVKSAPLNLSTFFKQNAVGKLMNDQFFIVFDGVFKKACEQEKHIDRVLNLK